MKTGVRALGVAESFREDRSTLAGVVCRATRIVDGFVFEQCTVGDSDATAAITEMIDRLDRPVLSVTFEESAGLESALREAFDGEELSARLETYRAQPERHTVDIDGETVYVRAVGCPIEEATEAVRVFTPEGGRPEPLRVARQAARAADAFDRA